MIPKWLEIAFGEMGQKEIAGDDSNPRIKEYHQETSLKASNDDVPWCSAFTCWVFEKCLIPSTKSAAARSWASWGLKLDEPKLGCVVVLKSGWPWSGHVGLYLDHDSSFVYLIGGNQGDKVSIRIFKKDRVLAFRWPLSEESSTLN